TANGVIHVHGTSHAMLHVTNSTTGTADTDGLAIQMWSDNAAYIWNYENTFTSFGVNNVEAMRLLAGGSLDIKGARRLLLNSHEALVATDSSWLRLNQQGHFTAGVYTPGLIRADGGFQVKASHGIRSYSSRGGIEVFGYSPSYCGVRLGSGGT